MLEDVDTWACRRKETALRVECPGLTIPVSRVAGGQLQPKTWLPNLLNDELRSFSTRERAFAQMQ